MSSINIKNLCSSFTVNELSGYKNSNYFDDSSNGLFSKLKISNDNSALNSNLNNTTLTQNLINLLDTLFKFFREIQKIVMPKLLPKDDLSNEDLADSDRIKIINKMVEEIKKLKETQNFKSKSINLIYNNSKVIKPNQNQSFYNKSKTFEFSKNKKYEDKKNNTELVKNMTIGDSYHIHMNINFNNINNAKSFSINTNKKQYKSKIPPKIYY